MVGDSIQHNPWVGVSRGGERHRFGRSLTKGVYLMLVITQEALITRIDTSTSVSIVNISLEICSINDL